MIQFSSRESTHPEEGRSSVTSAAILLSNLDFLLPLFRESPIFRLKDATDLLIHSLQTAK